METVTTAFVEKLLSFGNFAMLRFSTSGKLLDIRPHEATFWGWHIRNMYTFDISEHFLAPNNLTAAKFKELLKTSSKKPVPLKWKNPEGEVSPPANVLWMRRTSQEEGDSLLAVIKKDDMQENKAGFTDRKYYYQSLYLPGFIHNINGPLGTMFGRAELLKFKHPEMKDLDEVISVGYRLQGIINNFSTKINQERHQEKIAIHLNRFLSEESTFLQSDLFFKHHVTCQESFANNLPEFHGEYAALSGLFSECYRFFRQFVNEEKHYKFFVKSTYNQPNAGFSVGFDGEFSIEANPGLKLPFTAAGDANGIRKVDCPGLDTDFIGKCMASLGGKFALSGEKTLLTYRYEFPLPV